MPPPAASLDLALRAAIVAALESPEGQAAIRAAVAEAVPAPALPIELPRDENEEIPLSAACREKGYSVETLRRWIREGKLHARKGAKEWRVRRGDLNAALGKPSGPASVVDIREEVAKIRAGGRGRP